MPPDLTPHFKFASDVPVVMCYLNAIPLRTLAIDVIVVIPRPLNLPYAIYLYIDGIVVFARSIGDGYLDRWPLVYYVGLKSYAALKTQANGNTDLRITV